MLTKERPSTSFDTESYRSNASRPKPKSSDTESPQYLLRPNKQQFLARVWSGWKSAANLMKPKTILKWHEHAFLQWWRWKSRRKGGRPTIRFAVFACRANRSDG